MVQFYTPQTKNPNAFLSAMLAQGARGQTRTPMEGLGRLAQALAAGYSDYRGQQKLDERNSQAQQTIQRAIDASQQQWSAPDDIYSRDDMMLEPGGMNLTNTDGATPVVQQGAGVPGTEGGLPAMLRILATNPDTAATGLNIAASQLMPKNGSQETYGNSPIWGTDENGNAVLMQTSNRGNVKQVALPEGVTPERGQVRAQDIGNGILYTDTSGRTVGFQPKGIAPEKQTPFVAEQSAAIEAATQRVSGTKGQQALDADFAKKYQVFAAGGGFADAQKGISQLRNVQSLLASGGHNLSGPMVGSIPDALLPILNPKAQAARDQIEEVVQRNLRLILGAQFTEKEGARLIARAYNPSLEEAENARRVGRLGDAMDRAFKATLAASQYFEKNGTLSGYKGTARITLEDIERNAFGAVGAPGAGEPAAQGGQWKIERVPQ